MCHAQRLGVVGDGDILIAAPPGGERHIADGGVAVAPVGVQVQVAFEVAVFDEPGQPARSGRCDLAVVLAELRRDEVQPQELINIGFRVTLVHPAGGGLLDPVLADLHTLGNGQFPQGDIVFLGAGEVLQQVAILPVGHHAQVYLQPGVGAHRTLGGSAGDDFGHHRQAAEGAGKRRGLRRRSDDVQILNRFLHPPHAAGAGDVARPGDLLEHGNRCLRHGQYFTQEQPAAPCLQLLNGLEDVIRRFLSHAG